MTRLHHSDVMEKEDIDRLLSVYQADTYNVTANNSGGSSNDIELGGTAGNILLTLVHSLKVYVVPLIATVGLCGNMVSFVVFVGTYLRRTSSSIYLAALSLAATAFLVCEMVSWAVYAGVDIYAQNGWCQTFMYLTYVSSFLSVWYVVAFTVERYIAVHFPLRRQDLCTTKRAKVVVGVLAAGSGILYSFGTWTSGVSLPVIGVDPMCAPLPQYTNIVSIVNNMDTVVTLILPFLAILVMNVRIAYKVAQFYHDRKHVALREYYSSTQNTSCAATQSMTLTSNRKVAYTRTQVRVTKMLLMVSTIFLLLNLPRHTARGYSFIMSLSREDHTNTLTYLAWEQVFRVLYLVHFSINVFLYSAFGKNFRRAFFWLGRRIKHGAVEHGMRCTVQCYCWQTHHEYHPAVVTNTAASASIRLHVFTPARRNSLHRYMLNHSMGKLVQFD